jgi:hypothetical protein
LGCVIFDAALSLYRAYPELGSLYSSLSGEEIHKGMLAVYSGKSGPKDRSDCVKEDFPYKTTSWDMAASFGQCLPELEAKNIAICNILEGFYLPQQTKLAGILKSLGVDINVVSVSLTDHGLTVNFME